MASSVRNTVKATCAGCGESRPLRPYQARKGTFCKRCAGAWAAQPWRLQNPSNPEKNLIRQLGEMGIKYQREVFFKGYLLDFVIKDRYVIEVDGGRIHTSLRDPDKEKRRLDTIRNSFELLVITDGNTKHCKKLIKEFLNQ